jgi:hypothetical protein
MEQALGDVQQPGFSDPQSGRLVQQHGEVAIRRLVGTDVLSGQDHVEDNAQTPVAGHERLPIDVREDYQLEVLAEDGQSVM